MYQRDEQAEGYLQLQIQVSRAAVEIADALVLDAGALGIEHIDAEHPERPADLPPGTVRLRAFFTPCTDLSSLAKELRARLEAARRYLPGISFGTADLARLDEEDWADGWRKFFVPVRVGRFLIHPGWVQPDPDEGLCVRVDPGQAFGTGLHATTRLCLKHMDTMLPVDSFLDVGCGTGILSLAAARSGSERVEAVDTDPLACRVAEQNIELNGLKGRVKVSCSGPGQTGGHFALIVANILSKTLIDMASSLVALLEDNGALLLSGCLREEAQEIMSVFEQTGLQHLLTDQEGEWCLFHFTQTREKGA